MTKKTILFISANPMDTERIRFDEEHRELEAALDRSRGRDHFELKHKFAVKMKDIRRALLEFKPQIVHFSGHGGKTGLKIEDKKGDTHFVLRPDTIAELFVLLNHDIECVLLNAGYSENVAEAVHEHIYCVISMKQRLQDESSVNFVTGFYDALYADKDFETAFAFGCNAAAARNVEEYQIPQIFINRAKKKHVKLVIRSSEKFKNSFHKNADALLSLENYFEEKQLIKGTWDEIKQKIQCFFKPWASIGMHIELHLPLFHYLAFLVGRELPPKSGVIVNVFQVEQNENSKLWQHPSPPEFRNESPWDSKGSSTINKSGNEMAIAISVTHDIGVEVKKFLKDNLKNVSYLLHLKVKVEGHGAIKSPEHADELIHHAIKEIRSKRVELRSKHLHFFMSAPNGFVFWLGQSSTQITNITLYDYDRSNGEYIPTITL